MKTRLCLKLLGLFIFIVLLSACQTATPTVHPAVDTATPSVDTQPYPYPAPTQPSAQEPALGAYPQPPADAQPTAVDWAAAQELIMTEQVAKVIQSSTLEVTLYTKDARIFKTTEPAKDDVLQVIKDCGNPCQVIVVVNQ